MNDPVGQSATASTAMKASDFIDPDNVVLGLAAPSKAKVIETIAKQAGATLGIPHSVICDALLRRESLGSTGVGDGVAIPHTSVPGLHKPIGWLARLAKPIGFESIDGLPVDIVLILLTPAEMRKEHLNVLACMARSLRSQDVLQSIRSAGSVEQLHAALASESTALSQKSPR